MAPRPLNFGPFLRGVHAETDPYTQPKGSIPRASSMLMTARGALTPCDGSALINAYNGIVQSGRGRFLTTFLYQPTGVNPYYLAIAKGLDQPLNTPKNVSAVDGGAGGSLAAGTYWYKVTALDGAGGETNAPIEASVTIAANHLVTLTWSFVPNAFAYNVYRSSSSGTEALLTGVNLPVIQPTVSFTDDGSATAVPITFTITGAANIGGTVGHPSHVITANLTSTPSSAIVGQQGTISGNSNPVLNLTGTVTGVSFLSVSILVSASFTSVNEGSGGTFSVGGVAPPVSNTTQQTVLFKMPGGTIPVSYTNANIVALFPASLNAFGQVPTGGTGGSGTTGPGISGQGNSTPSGGVIGLVSLIPQMVQFTNRVALALGNGFAPQLYSDATGTTVNPALTGAITAISVDAFGLVTVTTSATLTASNMPIGSNTVLAGIGNALYNGTFVILSVNTGAGTFTLWNTAAIGQAASSGGTFTLTTVPIINTFVPAFPPWVTKSQYAVNSVITPATPTTNNSCFKVSQAGVTGASEPTWASFDNPGDTLSDGTVTWQNLGPVSLQAPAPPGAGHLIVYSGCLWAWNTAPKNTSSGIDGPCALRMSDVNNPVSWNPINQAFLDKDDGTEGMGLATFTISAEGIPPEGSLVAFKNYSGYQIIGIFGASIFSIQRIRSDMGCFAPRSIWFVPGYGIARYAHLGVALFDGVRDTVVSEEMRPYLFPTNDLDTADIVVADANWIPTAQGCLTANPPMYVLAIPIGASGGALTRILNYDLVLKCWGGPVDLPFSISCMTQVRPVTSNPLTIFGGFSDGTLQRWQAGDVQWYTGDPAAITSVLWSVDTPEAFGNPQDQKMHWRRLAIRGVLTSGSQRITITPEINGVAKAVQVYTLAGNGDFELFAGIRREGARFSATISGSGHLELSRFDFQVYPKAVGSPLVIS